MTATDESRIHHRAFSSTCRPTPGATGAHETAGVTVVQNEGVRVGATQVVDSPVLSLAPSAQTARIALEGGRFIECFRRRDIDQGYRLMAQVWTAHGLRVGPPVPISPGAVSVMTEPRLVSVDGRRVVATFVATSAERSELLAVSLDVL